MIVKKEKTKNKVLVAMSGGVDSSVVATILKNQGYDVIGCFLKLTDLKNFKESEKKAKEVAKVLNISFFVLDLRLEFKKKIIEYFIKEYKNGRTPNPCILCNKEIKFSYLLKEAKKRKCDFVATGHYVNIKNGKLFKANDKNKDQSYFLYRLTQKDLEKTICVLGEYTKVEVRKLAKKFKLPVWNESDSQEVCFILEATSDFLEKHIEVRSGLVLDNETREIVGEHKGFSFYTIGQRKGLGKDFGSAFAKASSGKPYYVMSKDVKKNILIVTKNEKDLEKKEFFVKNINWIGGSPDLHQEVKVKVRYRSKSVTAKISKITNGKYRVILQKSQRAITSGQSAVFYKGKELLGGGIIC